MEQRKQEAVELEVLELLIILLRKWWLILLIGTLCAILTGICTMKFIDPIYTSTSKVYIINREYQDIATWSDLQSGNSIAQDLMILVKSRPVIEGVIDQLNLDITPEELTKRISVYTPADTRIVEITAEQPNPEAAQQLVDAVTEISSERMVSVMQLEKVNILEKGNVPIKPSRPNVVICAIVAGILGGMVTVISLSIVTLLNDTIKTSDDIEKHLGIAAIGVIPMEKPEIKKKSKRERHKKNEILAS